MPKEAPWPRFVAPLRSALERIQPPDGPSDPQGTWEHSYSVLILAPDRQARSETPQPYGRMTIKRKPLEGGKFSLEVDQSLTTRAKSGLRTRASLTCAADRLGTPQRWELQSEPVEGDAPVAGTSVKETATVRDGVVVRTGEVARKIRVPKPFTTNWSLLDAVQRLPFDSKAALEFDMFEDLDMFKPGQSLRAVEPVTLTLSGREVRLHGYRQIGHGILPMHYWLDDQHRLIAVNGSLRALLWGADVPAGKRGRKR